ncbi:MAG: class B sortase [Defluviitaleaceae bacterium]|nr:class B sortase [Defluviitaleaceae bacterium]
MTIVFFTAAIVWDIYTIRQGQVFYASLSSQVNQLSAQPVEYLSNLIRDREIYVEIETEIEIEGIEVKEDNVSFIDFDKMREIFPNIVGWIKSEDTFINYPIVQGADNYFYLSYLPDGTYHPMGSIFLDYRNLADFSDSAILIYGHDMRSGDMFGSLKYYADQLYYEKHYSMFIFTPMRDYKLILFAGYILDSDLEVPPMSFHGSKDFEEYIADIRSRSIFTSGTEVSFEDRLVFLATCTRSGKINERLIIVGKLVEMYSQHS